MSLQTNFWGTIGSRNDKYIFQVLILDFDKAFDSVDFVTKKFTGVDSLTWDVHQCYNYTCKLFYGGGKRCKRV